MKEEGIDGNRQPFKSALRDSKYRFEIRRASLCEGPCLLSGALIIHNVEMRDAMQPVMQGVIASAVQCVAGWAQYGLPIKSAVNSPLPTGFDVTVLMDCKECGEWL